MQQQDTALARLRHERQSLPEQKKFLQLRADHERVHSDLIAAQTQLSDLDLAMSKAEADLIPVRERLQRNEQRIADGSVEAKALATMVDEVAHLKRRIVTLEDAELEVMQQREDAQLVHDRLAAKVESIEADLATTQAERDARAAKIDAVANEHNASRAELVVGLDAPLLALYDKLRASHSGLGAAELVQRSCSGCRIDVSPADLNTYAAASPDTVLRCEECGRILIRTNQSGI